MAEHDPPTPPDTLPLRPKHKPADGSERFLHRLTERVDDFADALAEQDLDALRDLSHDLKGDASGRGLTAIAMLAGYLEHQADAVDQAEQLHDTVQQLIDLCREAAEPTDPDWPPPAA